MERERNGWGEFWLRVLGYSVIVAFFMVVAPAIMLVAWDNLYEFFGWHERANLAALLCLLGWVASVLCIRPLLPKNDARMPPEGPRWGIAMTLATIALLPGFLIFFLMAVYVS